MRQKGVALFLMITLAILLLAGCGTTYALENPSVPEPPEMIFTDGLPIYVTPATDEFLSGFAEHLDLSFLEDGELRLAFVSNGAVRGFHFLEISCGDDGIRIENILFAQKELSPDKPIVVSWAEQGDVPHRGVSFADEDGAVRYFALEMDHEGRLSLRALDRIIDSQRPGW